MKFREKNFGALIILLGSVLGYALYSSALLAGPIRGENSDKVSYEAITGESADEDKSVWDSFYRDKNHGLEKDPVSFLKDYIHLIPKGRAFVPAMGEGRNAIFLAKKGFEVDGNDISDVAIEKTLGEAKQQKVMIKTILADLSKYSFPEDYYDFVLVSLFYSKALIPKFKASVRKGGYIMFYNRVVDTSSKRKSSIPDEFLVKPSDLKEGLKDFKIKAYKEYSDQGIKVVGILAQRPEK
ncbi:MAG: methyltransferase domain-containing protein [Bdellovibrionales bacterium]|nr:methyltransferase domain-containing protein [Bdellovibrionales bacterium]